MAAPGAGGEFVEGWLVAQVLGEGAYGEVRLLVHARTGAAVALKALRGAAGAGAEGEGEGQAAGAREAALHRALRHPHVVRCLGARAHLGVQYLFLEYAQGGELFDRIEPDRGMPAARARRYWRHLAAGLGYLHARGVAHRDIKPENLLLDARDRLKISDFGLATLFRHGARERLLARVCGTVPYAAPEVLAARERPYRAPPADLWAAAVVLLAMLAGELPWERAAAGDARYAAWAAWAEGPAGAARPAGLWRKLSGGALALVRRALRPRPARRDALDELARDPWLCADADAETPRVPVPGARGSLSQPAARVADGAEEPDGPEAGEALSAAHMDALVCYSQPAHADELLLSTQALSPGEAGGPGGAAVARLVRRMTRVWLRCDEPAALRALGHALRERRYPWRHLHPRILAIECGPEVRMRACVLSLGAGADADSARVMVEFRRSRGCGLEFKRRFLELRAALEPLSAPPPPHADLLAPLAAPAAPAEPMDET